MFTGCIHFGQVKQLLLQIAVYLIVLKKHGQWKAVGAQDGYVRDSDETQTIVSSRLDL
ncbi:hypothetical protein DPMN_045974 [Dreissena polymorpha]|uniref:Uncharacterized protein n=1 Tax=Dreissena polymorpha TaxID=45954 RepID=A0A9D4D7A0_DREPO|nr:hypothetical protein DPMN_045974 [Dreissena polymorpha]